MRAADVMNLSSMPMAAPSYPRGPYRFIDREYLTVTYESDPAAIREALPEPLEPDGSNTVLYEFIRMPDSAGFGDYTESGVVIPALFNGENVNFTAQMYLDDEPPIAGGREIWGFPKKNANPKLSIIHDTLTGVLEYAGVVVAVATMGYKHQHLLYDVNGRRQCSPEARRGCNCTRTSTRRWLTFRCARRLVACISSPTSRSPTVACCTTTRRPIGLRYRYDRAQCPSCRGWWVSVATRP